MSKLLVQYQKRRLSELKTNGAGTLEFDFDEEIEGFMFGLASFYFQYGNDDDHHVKTIAVKATGQVNPSNRKQVQVQISEATMKDNSKAIPDAGNSWVSFQVVAWTGEGSEYVSLSNSGMLDSKGSYTPSAIPNEVESSVAVLSGFDYSFPSDDHQVAEVNGEVSMDSSYAIQVEGKMAEENDKTVADCRLQVGALLSNRASPNFVLKQDNGVKSSGGYRVTLDIPEGQVLKQAAVMLTAFTVSYDDGDDHDVYRIGAGNLSNSNPNNDDTEYNGMPIVDGNEVIVETLTALIEGSHHGEDNYTKNSKVDVLIVGICEPAE